MAYPQWAYEVGEQLRQHGSDVYIKFVQRVERIKPRIKSQVSEDKRYWFVWYQEDGYLLCDTWNEAMDLVLCHYLGNRYYR